MKNQPKNTIDFMVQWLQKWGKEIQIKIQKTENGRPIGISSSSAIESDSQESSQDEKSFEVKTKKSNMQRTSVSAEVYGQYNQKKHFIPPVFSKSETEIALIKD